MLTMNGYEFVIAVLALVLAAFGLLIFRDRLKSFRIKGPGVEFSGELEPKSVRFGKELVEEHIASEQPEVVVSAEASGVVVGAPAGDVEVRDHLVLQDGGTGNDELVVAKQQAIGVVGVPSDAAFAGAGVAHTPTEEQRRAQLEVALNDAAEWGWKIARMGTFQHFPHPVIEWDAQGNPTIAYGSTDHERFRAIQEMAATANLALTSSLATERKSSGDIELGGGAPDAND